jgi:hypothetical protein
MGVDTSLRESTAARTRLAPWCNLSEIDYADVVDLDRLFFVRRWLGFLLATKRSRRDRHSTQSPFSCVDECEDAQTLLPKTSIKSMS